MDETPTFERGRTDGPEALRLCLPAAPADYLRGAVENPALGPEETVVLLRNRALPPSEIQKIARDRRWARVHDVKAGIVRHPRTPYAVARALLGHLFWRDLMDLAADLHVTPPLRRDAETILRVRLPELSLGEKVALARRASPGVIAALRETADAMVLKALFGNPRFIERDALAVATGDTTPPEALAALASHGAWGARRPVRLALLSNPRTPVAAALRLVENLAPEDLLRLAHDASAPRIVRVGAGRRLERPGRRPRDMGFG